MSLGGGLNFLKYTRKFVFVSIDAHGLKIQGEGQGGFCQILGGRVYRGCENFLESVHHFGVLLHFY